MRYLCWMICAPVAGIMLGASVVSGQDYPNKTIRIVTAQVGGSQDLSARMIAAGLTASMGQQVIVENRSGGTIGGEIVAKAPADGYTLIYTGSIFWTLPLMRKTPTYDVLKEFAPIALATREPLMLVAHPSLPVKTVKELIALAKARPGALNYGTGGVGSSNHLAAELFKAMAGVNIVGVQYRGVGGAIIGLVSGEVQIMIATTVGPHLQSGKLRAIAVTSAQPTKLYPGVPTIAATVPGYEATQKASMFAPAKTPVAIINRLNREIVDFLNKPEVKTKYLSDGVETVGSTPDELSAIIKSEIARMGKVVRDAGISAE